MYVEGRLVYLVRGSKTQTINICTPANQRGNCERVYRLDQPSFVTEAQVAEHHTLAELDYWLTGRGAAQEEARGSAGAGTPGKAARPALVDLPPGEAWLTTATRVVEVAIDSLVLEFVEHPYLHRVEHSLHARLFGILAAHPILSHLAPIGRSGHHTQPVHKEWPETKPRPEKGDRRGNFDLAVLAPEQLAHATLDDFRTGRVASAIVIEIGLDYDYQHLKGDHDKLLNSAMTAGYLIDLARGTPRVSATEDLILNPTAPLRTAYAHHAPDGTCTFKTLLDTELHQSTRLTGGDI